MKRLLSLTGAAVILAALALAQVPDGENHKGRRGPRGDGFEQFQQALGLSEGQMTAIRENNQALRETIRSIVEQARASHEALADETESETPNPTVIGEQILSRKAVGDAIKAATAETREKNVALLDSNQQATLAAIQEAVEMAKLSRPAATLNLLEGPGQGPMSFGRHGPGPGSPHGPRGPRQPQ